MKDKEHNTTMDDDDDLAALEAELGGDALDDEDDVFASLDHCMDAKEFLKKVAGNTETLVAVFPEVEFSDDMCKALTAAIGKASKLEGIAVEGINVSRDALSRRTNVNQGLILLLDAMRKHPGLKYINISGLEMDSTMIKLIAEFIANNQKLISFKMEDIDLNAATVKVILQSLEKNRSLHHFHITTMEDAYLQKIDQIMKRNRESPVPNAAKAPLTATAVATAPTPSASSGKMITLWVKGQVHIGELPPNEPGWTRFTFDSGTQFSTGGNSTTSSSSSASARSTPATGTTAASALKTLATTAPAAKAPTPSATTLGAPPSKTPVSTAAPAAKPQAKVLFRVKALYEYAAQDDDEASFRVGDMIDVLKTIDEDWYVGKVERTGKSGQIPANHVQVIK